MEPEKQNVENMQGLLSSVSKQAFVTFKTTLPEKYQIEENVITVDTNSSDRDLNKLINAMIKAEQDLDVEEEEPYQFEFLLNNDFIKGTLKSHLVKHQLITEKTIEIQYTFALQKPKLQKTLEQEDWVWCISKFDGDIVEKGPFGVAHFDGTVSFYNASNQKLSNVQITNDGSSVKDLKIVADGKQQDSYFVATASSDERLVLSTLKITKKAMKFDSFCYGIGHSGNVTQVEFNPLNNKNLITGGADGKLNMYRVPQEFYDDLPETNGTTSKKQKIELKEMKPTLDVSLSGDEISKLLWIEPETIIASSFDHTIKFVDVNKMREKNLMNCKDNVVSSISYSNGLLVSAHEDCFVKIWDEKASNTQPIKIIKAHSKYVSDVKFHPNNSVLFLTGSHDSQVKLWDFRNTFPLVTLKDQKEKIFSVEWNGDSNFLTGGSDSKVMSYDFTQNVQ